MGGCGLYLHRSSSSLVPGPAASASRGSCWLDTDKLWAHAGRTEAHTPEWDPAVCTLLGPLGASDVPSSVKTALLKIACLFPSFLSLYF